MVENSRYGNRLIASILSFIILISLVNSLLPIGSVEASTRIDIQLNGHILKIPSNSSIVKDGRVFVPIRSIAEEMGVQVEWNSTHRKVTLAQTQNRVELWLGSLQYNVNGINKKLDVQPFMHQNRTLVPLRFVSEGLGSQISWDPSRRMVTISTDGSVPANTIVSRSTEAISDDVYWLAKIIYSEARGEPMTGQIAVGAVVLNRVKSKDFPNSIYGVIFDKWGSYYQFEPVQNGSLLRLEPNATAYQAARRAIAGEDPTNGTLFFHNPTIAKSAWMAAKPVAIKIGQHEFMY